jgi:hypothetical protein
MARRTMRSPGWILGMGAPVLVVVAGETCRIGHAYREAMDGAPSITPRPTKVEGRRPQIAIRGLMVAHGSVRGQGPRPYRLRPVVPISIGQLSA